MKEYLKLLIPTIVFASLLSGGLLQAQMGGGISIPNFWTYDGTALSPIDSAMELGSNAARIAKGWFGDLDTTVITVGGASAGDLTVYGKVSAYYFQATSTTPSTFDGGIISNASSTFAGNLTVDGAHDIIVGRDVIVTRDLVVGRQIEFPLFTAFFETSLGVFGISGDQIANWDINLLTNDRTFFFPDLNGTFLMATGTQDFETSGNATTSGDFSAGGVLYIDQSGNVGIGTTTPENLLDVDGKIRSDGIDAAMSHVHLYSTTTQTISSGGTPQFVTWEGVRDQHGDWSVVHNEATTTLSIPNNGDYSMTYCFQPELNSGANIIFEYALFKNGVQEIASGGQRHISSSNDIGSTCRIYHADFITGDNLGIKISADNTNIMITASSTVFSEMPTATWTIEQVEGDGYR